MSFSPRRLASIFVLPATALAALLVLSVLPQHAAPQFPSGGMVLDVDPAASKVHWTLGSTLHAVHGTFALNKGTLQWDPETGKASGEIVVEAVSGNSGDDSRDRKMHKDVLESARYTDIVFRPDKVEGKIAQQGPFRVQIHGILTLHGREHEITVPAQVEFAGDHWSDSTKFDIPFIDWGLKNPSNFFLKVSHTVNVELGLKGSLRAAR